MDEYVLSVYFLYPAAHVTRNTISSLQELSYMLCYNYARATKAVSIPAPVYCEFFLSSTGFNHADFFTDADVSGYIILANIFH